MTGTSIFAPGFKTTPYWWEDAAPAPGPAQDLPSSTDVAIVGGGYAGLSAALELARHGTDVCVFDAEICGHGASSRSGGMVSGGVNVGKGGNLATRLGPDGAKRLLEDAAASYSYFETVIERERIDCRYARTGRFVGAHSPKAFDDQARRAALLNEATHAGVRMVPRAEQHAEIATDIYHGGMVVERSGGVHPALYFKGLAEASRRAGARLFDRTPVAGIARADDRFAVTTARGTVSAREVVVATNGYTGKATPWHRRRVIPVASYIIATEEIGIDTVRALFPTLRMIAETRRVLHYYRPSPDGKRIIFGGRASFRDVTAEASAPRLHADMCAIFPSLKDVRITHAWKGNVAFTFDYLPHMGTHERIHYCLGCNGSGVVMMSYLGWQTALKILGRRNRPCAFDGLPFETRPFYHGVPWFLPAVGTYYRIRDALDDWRARS